jgi:hypothetical protein
MLNIKKGTKVFFLQVNGEKVEKAEWTKVTRDYVDSTTWTCDTVLDLENGHLMFDEDSGASAHKRDQQRLSDNVLMNQFVWGVFTFIGTTKGETIKLANQFLTGETSEIQHDIRVLEDRISKILEVKKKLLKL